MGITFLREDIINISVLVETVYEDFFLFQQYDSVHAYTRRSKVQFSLESVRELPTNIWRQDGHHVDVDIRNF